MRQTNLHHFIELARGTSKEPIGQSATFHLSGDSSEESTKEDTEDINANLASYTNMPHSWSTSVLGDSTIQAARIHKSQTLGYLETSV